jgi:carbon-monoxide dehydrogenase medium subunit
MNRFEYHAPATLDEAHALLAEHGEEARVLAGGTALVILMKQELVQPAHLVDLGRVGHQLSGVRVEDGVVRIGALTTLRDLENSSIARDALPVLGETLKQVASVRIRNMATLGGNLAHGDPALDPPAALIACDARVRVTSASGTREVPLDSFYVDYYETVLQPTEILTEVVVPVAALHSATVYLKLLPRTHDDYATIGVAARLTLDEAGERIVDARIALAAAGSTVIRARQAEAALRGESPTDSAFRAAGVAARDEVDPLSDIRGSADYKRDMAAVMVRRALEAAGRRIQ